MDVLFIVMIGMILCIIGLIIYLFMDNKKYCHKVEIREITQGRKLIIHDKARDFRDEDNNLFWRLKKEKNKLWNKIPVPPSESIEIDKKGKKCVVIYRDDNGSIKFFCDKTVAFNNIKQDQPLTTNQRSMYIQQMKKAHARNKKTWLDNLPLIGMGMGIVILIVVVAVFMEDAMKPFNAMASQVTKQSEIMLEVVTIQRDMKLDIQSLKSDGNSNNLGSSTAPD